MSPRFAFSLLFSFCAVGLGMAIPAFPVDERCGPNAVFLECGSACAPTCKNPHPGPICTLQCVIGCFCKQGFLKNEKGECVLPQECDGQTHPKIHMQIPSNDVFPTCPENEEFQACGTACPATCANPHPSPICTKNCVVGCFCKQGFLRNSRGVCVMSSQCEAPEMSMLFAFPPEVSQCKENEMFMACGSACAPTCANPHPSPVCTKNCVVGCFCKPGYLKDERGECVPSERCGVPAAEAVPVQAPVCGKNEEYRQCKGCDGTCDNPNPICPRICIPGCACKKDHLRTGPNGECIPKEQCPRVRPAEFQMLPPFKCREHEEFHACGTACPATCANPHPSPVCTRNCVIGCFCKQGYLKNAKGDCVPAADCDAPATLVAAPEHKCPSDREHYIEECGSQMECVYTCHVPPPPLVHGYPRIPKMCLERKCAPACVCKFPYVRNVDGRCVERKACDDVTTPLPLTTAH